MGVTDAVLAAPIETGDKFGIPAKCIGGDRASAASDFPLRLSGQAESATTENKRPVAELRQQRGATTYWNLVPFELAQRQYWPVTRRFRMLIARGALRTAFRHVKVVVHGAEAM